MNHIIYHRDKSTQKGMFSLDNYVMNKALVTTCLDKYFPQDVVDNVIVEYLPNDIFSIDKNETLSEYDRCEPKAFRKSFRKPINPKELRRYKRSKSPKELRRYNVYVGDKHFKDAEVTMTVVNKTVRMGF